MAFLSALGRAAPGGAENLQTGDYGTGVTDAKTNYDQATGKQNDLVAHLLGIQNGTGGPSLAEQQLFDATQRNAQANAAGIASARGVSPQLQARQIANTTAGLNQAESGQAAELRSKEQAGASDLIARILSGQASNDTSLYGTAAGASNNANTNSINNARIEQDAYKTDLNASGNLLNGLATAGTTLATAAPACPTQPPRAGMPEASADSARTVRAPPRGRSPTTLRRWPTAATCPPRAMRAPCVTPRTAPARTPART